MYLSARQKSSIIHLLKNKIPSLEALYLFGSYVDGRATISSDIDIAYLSKKPFSQLERWDISQIVALSLEKDVDLVDLRQTNTIFRYQIISQGIRLYGSGYEVESFETLAYSFYLRFQEERKPIIDAIYADKKIFHG